MKAVIQILALILWLPLTAQDVRFVAKVSRNQLAVGEHMQVQFELNAGGSNFKAPAMDGFQVLSGPNQSQSMQWINGNMNSSISWSFVITPTKEGNLTIGPASVQVNGNSYKTEPIQIKVAKGNPQAQGGGQPQQGNRQQRNTGNEIGDNVFIRLNLDKTKVSVGEGIVATYKIYTRLGIAQNQVSALPSFNGFWAQEIELPNQSTLAPEILDGVQYNAAVLKKTILFPQQSGELTVDPLSMDLVVQITDNSRPRNIFDQVFGRTQNVEFKAVSNTVKVKVSPLPENGKPAGYTGAVGEYSISSTADKTTVKNNEAINFTVTIKGKGNLKLIEKPALTFPADFEVYDPKISDKYTATTAGVSGSKVFEYVVIPRHAGDFVIPAIPFGYYDPSKKTYVELRTGEINIHVEKGEAEESITYSSPSKEDVKMIGKDIRFIKSGPANLRETGSGWFGSPLFWISYFSIPGALAILLLLAKKRAEENSDLAGLKSRRANKEAIKRLKQANKLMIAGNKNGFYEELARALFGYLSDRFKIPVSELSRENIGEKLAALGIASEVTTGLFEVLDKCDMARYAPVGDNEPGMLYQQSIDIIGKIEGGMK